MEKALKIALLPISYLYGAVTFIRNKLFDFGILKETKFDVHSIGVGNLSVGGAGKTPHVEYLIRLLLNDSKRIATLSRGYKRKTSGFVLATEQSTALDIGDEPLIYKTNYPVTVAVDANRKNGINKLINTENLNLEVILLDDVFQHRYVKPGLSICVSDYNQPYFEDVLMPSGTLREAQSGISRADVIIISKTPENTSPVDIRNVLKDIKPLAHQKVFFSYLKYGELYSINNRSNQLSTLNDLYRYRVISFAGIANATPFIEYLKEYSAELKHLPFPDHYEYLEKDLTDIQRYYESLEGGNKLLVTTEKDLMRLKNNTVWDIASRMNIYILPVEITFKDKEEEFNQLILNYVRTNRIYHQKYT